MLNKFDLFKPSGNQCTEGQLSIIVDQNKNGPHCYTIHMYVPHSLRMVIIF